MLRRVSRNKPNEVVDEAGSLCALLVIDMQEPFFKVVENPKETVNRVYFAIQASQMFGMHIVLTEQTPEKLGPTQQLISTLAKERAVFPKNCFSALQAPGLREHLEAKGVQHILLTGLEIPICIYQTAIEALAMGLEVTVLSDCVTARRNTDSFYAREALVRAGCHWLPTETVFYSMLGSAEHPKFRDFSRAVKDFS